MSFVDLVIPDNSVGDSFFNLYLHSCTKALILIMLALTWQWHYVSCLEHKHGSELSSPELLEFEWVCDYKRNSFQNAALQLSFCMIFPAKFLNLYIKNSDQTTF